MEHLTGALLILAAGVLWSVQGVLIRQIHQAGSWAVLFWRSLGRLPVLVLWTDPRQIGPAIKGAGWARVIGGLGLALAFGGGAAALQSTTVANAVLLFSAFPFNAAIFGLTLLHERVVPAKWGAILLAVLGVLIMVGGVGQIGGGTTFGSAAALFSAAGFADFTVAVRWGHLTNMLPAVLLGGIFTRVAGGVAAILTGQPLAIPPVEAAITAGMGTVTLTGGMFFYTVGSRAVRAAEATLLSLAEVLLAPSGHGCSCQKPCPPTQRWAAWCCWRQ